MGISDKARELRDKAKEAMRKDDNVDKVAEKAKGAVGDRYDDQIDKAAEKAKDLNDKI
jgi:hypothetical protein